MRTIEKTVYNFDELTEGARSKAIENLFDINVDHEWYDMDLYDAERIGLKITSFDLDRNRHAKGEFILSANEVAQNIFNEHGEHCETYKTAKAFMDEWQPVYDQHMNEDSERFESYEAEEELQDIEDEFLKSLLEDYSIMLQNQYEYLMSEEAIIETIEANEYEFNGDGTIF